jgi:hypothetical protein
MWPALKGLHGVISQKKVLFFKALLFFSCHTIRTVVVFFVSLSKTSDPLAISQVGSTFCQVITMDGNQHNYSLFSMCMEQRRDRRGTGTAKWDVQFTITRRSTQVQLHGTFKSVRGLSGREPRPKVLPRPSSNKSQYDIAPWPLFVDVRSMHILNVVQVHVYIGTSFCSMQLMSSTLPRSSHPSSFYFRHISLSSFIS